MTKFIKGNEAIVVGALYAGCDLYFGYPITPASEIAHGAAKWFPQLGRTFVQAECETASVNMMFGAASAGKLCMTATSGPGFSLMQEGISYMAAGELPGVFVDVMRAGPGLGNVYPEQGDYTPAVKGGGHGNYQCFVLAPASVQEMCDYTIKAFEMSAKYRTPAIVLVDGLQGQMMETLVLPEKQKPHPDFSAWAAQGEAKTRQNLITTIYLDVNQQEDFNNKLQAKYATMVADVAGESYMADDAELMFVAYGVSSRIARTAAEELRSQGVKAGVFRPITLNPFPREALAAACRGRKVLTIEHDAGQFADDVRLQLAKSGEGDLAAKVEMVHRMGGQVVSVDETVAAAKRLMNA